METLYTIDKIGLAFNTDGPKIKTYNMKIVFEYDNISASSSLETLVEKKLKNLIVKYPFVIRGNVFFKKENYQEEKDKGCGIRLSAPGPRIYASSTEDSFESAIRESIRDLENQLERRKDKMSNY